MTPLPKEPFGPHPLVQTVRQVIRCLRERTILNDPTILLDKTVEGTKISVVGIKKSGGGGSSPADNVPRWG